jgi:hypothetical protein
MGSLLRIWGADETVIGRHGGAWAACAHRRAAPDPEARRGVAITADIEGDALFFEQAGERLGEIRLGVGRQSEHLGVDHGQADRGVGADRRAGG